MIFNSFEGLSEEACIATEGDTSIRIVKNVIYLLIFLKLLMTAVRFFFCFCWCVYISISVAKGRPLQSMKCAHTTNIDSQNSTWLILAVFWQHLRWYNRNENKENIISPVAAINLRSIRQVCISKCAESTVLLEWVSRTVYAFIPINKIFYLAVWQKKKFGRYLKFVFYKKRFHPKTEPESLEFLDEPLITWTA